MGWADTWDDMLQGGSPRWKITDSKCHQAALSNIQQHLTKDGPNNILCPLAGDDPMVHLLWQQGHSVTAIDLVPTALEQMRNQFDGNGSWTRQEHYSTGSNNVVVWKHDSGRATQYEGDVLQVYPELKNSFDAVYDKDSFGALNKEMRKPFCARIREFTKAGAIIYMEVKLKENHEQVKDMGPPYSLQKEDLMHPSCYGEFFDYVKGLGSVYPVALPGMQQTGHILKRK